MTTHSYSVDALFKPFAVGNLSLPNRLVMAPMTRLFAPDGVPGPDLAAYYKRRAEHGVGLIITEGTVIEHPASSLHSNVPSFYGEDALQGWKRVVEEVHAAGGRIIPQVWHAGTSRQIGSEPNPEALPVGPSGINQHGEKVNEPLTEPEIALLIESFAQAAADAKQIGFDGIEIHGAHGYLIDQFLWDVTNRRTDRYGGRELAARTRFAVEIIKASRRAVGPDFPILFRFSQWKVDAYTAKLFETPEQLASFLEPLTEAGVDVFHPSTRRFWQPELDGSELNLAGWTRKLTGKPTIAVGSVGLEAEFIPGQGAGIANNLEKLIERLNKDEFDLVGVGRALLANPAWAQQVREGRFDELVPYTEASLKELA